jgi:hypothetical protein
MKSLSEDDIREVRATYAWHFAETLGMDGHQVDSLRLSDFYGYCLGLDLMIEQRKKEAQEAARNK